MQCIPLTNLSICTAVQPLRSWSDAARRTIAPAPLGGAAVGGVAPGRNARVLQFAFHLAMPSADDAACPHLCLLRAGSSVTAASVSVQATGNGGSAAYDYDLITIGAGSGGVRASRFATSYGAGGATPARMRRPCIPCARTHTHTHKPVPHAATATTMMATMVTTVAMLFQAPVSRV
jgi:hypothetical protein